jgi:hypothetical protein
LDPSSDDVLSCPFESRRIGGIPTRRCNPRNRSPSEFLRMGHGLFSPSWRWPGCTRGKETRHFLRPTPHGSHLHHPKGFVFFRWGSISADAYVAMPCALAAFRTSYRILRLLATFSPFDREVTKKCKWEGSACSEGKCTALLRPYSGESSKSFNLDLFSDNPSRIRRMDVGHRTLTTGHRGLGTPLYFSYSESNFTGEK